MGQCWGTVIKSGALRPKGAQNMTLSDIIESIKYQYAPKKGDGHAGVLEPSEGRGQGEGLTGGRRDGQEDGGHEDPIRRHA